MKVQHTPGALRAAKVIMNDQDMIGTEYGKKRLAGIADLIDRETAAPELLEACGTALIRISGIADIAAALPGTIAQLQAAIAQAEGGTL